MRVFVPAGTGSIGLPIVPARAEHGQDIWALVRFAKRDVIVPSVNGFPPLTKPEAFNAAAATFMTETQQRRSGAKATSGASH